MNPRVAPAAVACAILGVFAFVVAGALPARAGVEEFSTFSVEEQERDDESFLDHILVRTPLAWRHEWERAPVALRSSQGCLTSGSWFNETDLKVRTLIGKRAWFGLALRQHENDQVHYNYTEFSFHAPTRIGTFAWMFRTARDKSNQDMALTWDAGADTSAFQLQATFGLEDVFNNFWEFRQTVTGGRAEPYLRHPWEPGLRMVVRRPNLRAEIGGRYLTPSTKRLAVSYADPSLDNISTLWGTLGWATIEARALGVEWETRTTNHQAASAEHPIALPEPDGRDFRRQWSAEVAVRRRIAPRLTVEARWLYQARSQLHGPPVSPPRFEAVDRVIQLEAAWTRSPSLAVRLGGLHDRISVQNSGITAPFSFGSRTESRAYVGLMARFGGVSLQLVEGIELDHEPYEVWAVHDKGFVQLQAVF